MTAHFEAVLPGQHHIEQDQVKSACRSNAAGFLAIRHKRHFVAFAAQIVFPKPEDTAYYFGVARNFLEGRGLVSDALWSYATPPLVFPRPAFEVWLPLPTFLAAIPMAFLGHSFAAAQVSSVLIGAIVPVLGWQLARDIAAERDVTLARARWIALGAGKRRVRLMEKLAPDFFDLRL